LRLHEGVDIYMNGMEKAAGNVTFVIHTYARAVSLRLLEGVDIVMNGMEKH
jgi:hypothetical protein